MSDLIKTLKQIALRKRDEKGEQGKRVSEKGFVEWKAADEIERLQARVEELEKVRVAVLKHRDNKEFLNIDTWNACVYAAEAATKQGESDERPG